MKELFGDEMASSLYRGGGNIKSHVIKLHRI